jgi:hypothetical protein
MSEHVESLVDIDAELQAMDVDPCVLVDVGRGVLLEILIDVPKQVRLLKKYIAPSKTAYSAKAVDMTIEIKAKIKEETGKDNPTGEEIQSYLEANKELFKDYLDAVQIDEGEQDYYGLGVAVCAFARGWRGVKSAFSKEKVTRWISRKKTTAELLGKNFSNILEKYEKAHEVQAEADTKN